MLRVNIYMILVAAVVVLTGCERRELYVYGSEFHSVTLNVDWCQYQAKDPDGMTAWFWPLDGSGEHGTGAAPYSFTTSQVRRYDLYLPSGRYRGVVVDYSPAEYSRQLFLDLPVMEQARVEGALDTQPLAAPADGSDPAAAERNSELYDTPAYSRELPRRQEDTGLYTVLCQPENMAQDTLQDMQVTAGEYGDYIPYEERDSYQEQMVVREFRAVPATPLWRLRIRVPLKGINNLWQMESTIAGLADGHLLALDRNSDVPCLMIIDEWDIVRTDMEGTGYIETWVSTFGLRPSSVEGMTDMHRDDGSMHVESQQDEIRLNLRFLLRDHATVVTRHLDVGTHVTEVDGEHLLVIKLEETDFGDGGDMGPEIVLPYVEPYDGAGFGADVTPWVDSEEVDVEF